MQALKVAHAADPKEDILKEVEPYIDGFEPLAAQMLVAIYVRPNKTASGLYLSDRTVQEDVYQGKVGLILKMGPLAFKDDATHSFGTVRPKVGDWIVYRIGDTFPFVLGKQNCRFVEDVAVKAIIQKPDVVL